MSILVVRMRKIISLLIPVLFFSGSMRANAGVPMLVVSWPIFWFALVPIIYIEWLVLKKYLSCFEPKRLLHTAAISNAVSTLVGLPIAWGCMAIIQIYSPGGEGSYPHVSKFWRYFLGVTLQAPWLIPYENQFYWMLPTAFIVLLIPFFFVSYWIEGLVTLSLLTKHQDQPAAIKQGVWKTNVYFYSCLSIANVLILDFLLDFIAPKFTQYLSFGCGSWYLIIIAMFFLFISFLMYRKAELIIATDIFYKDQFLMIRYAVWKANIYSYIFLFTLAFLYLMYGVACKIIWDF